MPIKCVIVSPDNLIFEGNADIVLLPTVFGQMGVMEHHRYLFTELDEGLITVRDGENEHIFTVYSGFVEVQPEIVRVLAETAEDADEIDIDRAEKARQRAKEALEKLKDQDSPEFIRIVAKMERSNIRLRAVRRRKRR